MKYYLLKYILASIAITAKYLVRKERWTWMVHFLIGDGSPLRLPRGIILEHLHLLLAQVTVAKKKGAVTQDKNTLRVTFENSPQTFGTPGFWGKPELFYLVGGFTFTLHYKTKGRVTLHGVDRYDWHPWPSGEWAISPFPCRFLLNIAGKLFGNEYFSEDGISNKLWADLVTHANCKEFNSILELNLNSKEFRFYKRRATVQTRKRYRFWTERLL